MLTMGKLFEVLKKNNAEMRMNRMDFFSYFIPEEMESMWSFMEKIGDTDKYRSGFFNGNLTQRGLPDKIEKILNELREEPDFYINSIVEMTTVFLQTYGKNSRENDCFKMCLDELRPEIEQETVLHHYVAARENNRDSYADILAILYLYATTLWKKDVFLKFLGTRYQNGVSEEWSFDVERAEFYADCGFEKTIFQTSIVEQNGVKWLDVKVNLAPTLIRPTIPKWCSVVFKMRPPRDIRYFNSITFRVCPVAEEGEDDCGIEQIVVEVKPEDTARLKHYPKAFCLQNNPVVENLSLKEVEKFNPEILRQFNELCFVVNSNNLTGLASDDPKKLRGHFRIAQIRLN